jgi:hypothetical protein
VGSLSNTAAVALPPGWTDPTPSNNSATDTDVLQPAPAPPAPPAPRPRMSKALFLGRY